MMWGGKKMVDPSFEILISLLKDFGFPAFVAIWLLVKDAKQKADTVEALNQLKTAIEIMTISLRGMEEQFYGK